MKEIIGRKVGMTQVFAEDGTMYAVTVVEVLPNVVTQIKTEEVDGYNALQIGYEEQKEQRVNKPRKGIFAKAGVTTKKHLFELQGDELSDYKVGDAITVDIFQKGDMVDVTGRSKGKGFSGTIKRHGHASGPRSHGSRFHRGPGSIASGITDNRVHKGTKMPGHHGDQQVTVLNLQIVDVIADKNALLIKGAIPGPKKGLVKVRSAIKTQLGEPKVIKPIINRAAEGAVDQE